MVLRRQNWFTIMMKEIFLELPPSLIYMFIQFHFMMVGKYLVKENEMSNRHYFKNQSTLQKTSLDFQGIYWKILAKMGEWQYLLIIIFLTIASQTNYDWTKSMIEWIIQTVIGCGCLYDVYFDYLHSFLFHDDQSTDIVWDQMDMKRDYYLRRWLVLGDCDECVLYCNEPFLLISCSLLFFIFNCLFVCSFVRLFVCLLG